MHWIRHVGGATAAALAIVPPATAQDAPPPPPLRIQGDLGLVSTAGNSAVTTLNLGEKVILRLGPIKLTQTFSVVYGRTGDSTTTNQWKASARSDVQIGGPVAVYARGAFERNTTAGISRRFEQAAGFAAEIIMRERTTLEAEAGAALNQQTSTSDSTTRFASGRAAISFKQFVTGTAFVSQELEALPNLDEPDDLRFNSETALTAPISSRFAVRLAYTVKFDNLPEPGFERTDRIFSAGVQVVF